MTRTDTMQGAEHPPAVDSVAFVPKPSAAPTSRTRLQFIDNIRWAMILLVLGMHAADTYSPFGNWYYTERPPVGPATALFFVTYQGFLQAFFMALLFFVAGYFVPDSYDAKGPARFVAGRAYRLGLPTLLYVFAIGPVTEFYIAHSWRTKQSFAHEMGLYVTRARFLSGTGPMWFCAALLIFCCGYAAYRLCRGTRQTPRPVAPRPHALGVVITIGALTATTFGVRLLMPVGTSVFNMQLPDFASYVLMFCLGVTARRGDWLERTPARFAWTSAALCVGLALLAWPPLLLFGGGLKGEFHAYAGGWRWQSAALCLWEALVCVGMAFGVLAGFRRLADTQGAVSRFLSDNAFAVYVLHPPLLIAVAIGLAPLSLGPIPKFALLWALSLAVCFGVAAPVARRVPILGRVLS